MARAKEITYYNDRFKGSLSDKQCAILENIISLDKDNGYLSDLKHCITNIGEATAQTFIEEMEAYNKKITDFEVPIGELRDEQTLGTAFMFTAKSCILGDTVGLGKTVQVSALFNLLDKAINEKIAKGERSENRPFRFLYLTEKNLVSQTRLELVRFTGKFIDRVSSDAKPCAKFFNYYEIGHVLEYSIIGSHSLLNQGIFFDWFSTTLDAYGYNPFDILVIDESSVVGNLKSGITKNLLSISKSFDRIVFLNATPFEAKLDTFYAQLSILDPTYLPVKTNFQKQYVVFDYRGMYPRPTGKYKNAEDFRRKVGYRYFARTREEKGAIMEDCSGRVLVSPLSKIQKQRLQKTSIPQMVYDCPNYFDSDIEFNIENVPKLASLKEALEVDCEDAETILIYVRHLEAQDSICKWLSENGYTNRQLNGETKKADRDIIIKGFRNGEYKVLVTNVQKGLNFGNCNYCIFYGFDPNPNKMVQFEGRITRSFDIIDKHVVVLCSEGAEYKRFNNIIKKRAEASSKFSKADISCIMSILLGD